MTATLTDELPPAGEAPEPEAPVEAQHDRRRTGFGVATILLGLVMLVSFGLGSESGLDSTFTFSRKDVLTQVPDLTMPARATVLPLAILVIVAGIVVVATAWGRRYAYLVFGVSAALFTIALLIWAARDGSVSIIGLIDGAVFRSTPLALGALAGLLCERSGVVNIAIEGMLLTAAFTAAITSAAAGSPWVGLGAGMAAGLVLGAFLGVLSIKYQVDQIIGGTVINLFALGMTSYLAAQILADYPNLNEPASFTPFGIPLLDRLPVLGPVLFDNTIYAYIMFGLVIVLWWALFRTRWGLRVRSVGEHPRAADTVGIKVLRTRYRSVMMGGVVAGIGGTWFTLDATGSFTENMTFGKGYIALAALIFGRWHPVGAFLAALLFGFTEELQTRLALLDTPIPSDFLLMLPYIVTIVVVAGLVGRSRPPAADGQPYVAG
jgi:general nucleoside transport system permease protein